MAGRKGRSGGRKKPPAGLLLHGQFREDRHGSKSAAEESVRAAKAEPIPTAPAFLPAAARQEWRRVAMRLHTAGLLRAVDRAALVGYCQAWAELREAEEGIAIEVAEAEALLATGKLSPQDVLDAQRIVQYRGRVVPGKNGWVRNPAVVIANQAAKRVREFCIEFGMTPSSQHRMEFSRGETGGGVDEFRGRHPKAHQG